MNGGHTAAGQRARAVGEGASGQKGSGVTEMTTATVGWPDGSVSLELTAQCATTGDDKGDCSRPSEEATDASGHQ